MGSPDVGLCGQAGHASWKSEWLEVHQQDSSSAQESRWSLRPSSHLVAELHTGRHQSNIKSFLLVK